MALRKPVRTGPFYLSLIVVLATVGLGYALWSSSLFIRGEINTGDVSAEFLSALAFTDDDDKVDNPLLDSLDTGDCPLPPGSQTSCDPAASGPDPKPRWDKDVGRCDATVLSPEQGLVKKTNVYPGYFCTAWFGVHNNGSVPVRIARATVNGVPVTPSVPTPFDLDGDGVPDARIHLTGIRQCQQIDPSNRVFLDIDQEILQGAPQGADLSYVVEVSLQQWNEDCGLEIDELPNSRAIIGIQDLAGNVLTARVEGPTTVHVNLAGLADPDGNGQEQVQTEIVAMSLTGNMPGMGPVEVRLQADRRTVGEIEENANTQDGRLDLPPFAPDGTADSFFDVFFEIEVGGLVLHNEEPMRIGGTITHKPPNPGDTYTKAPGPIPLFTPDGEPSGFALVEGSHVPNPTDLPDLVVREIRGPTEVDCVLNPDTGLVECDATVDFTIANIGAGAAGAFSVLVEADQVPSARINVAGLAAGASLDFKPTLGLGGNCYDRNCTVKVTVDFGNAVAESNETNNVDTRTDLG